MNKKLYLFFIFIALCNQSFAQTTQKTSIDRLNTPEMKKFSEDVTLKHNCIQKNIKLDWKSLCYSQKELQEMGNPTDEDLINQLNIQIGVVNRMKETGNFTGKNKGSFW